MSPPSFMKDKHMLNVDTNAVVAAYQADTQPTVATVATTFNIKAHEVATILKLNGVKIRRGNHGVSNLTPEARAKGLEVRQSKAQARQIAKLINLYGRDAVLAAASDTDAAT